VSIEMQLLNACSLVIDFSFVSIDYLNFKFVFVNLVTPLVNSLSTSTGPRHSHLQPNLGSAALAKAFNTVISCIGHPILSPNIISITRKVRLLIILVTLVSCVIGEVSIRKQSIATTCTTESLL